MKGVKGVSLLGQSRTEYPSSPDAARLEWFPNPHPARRFAVHFVCPEFTSVCPVTGQPDFARFSIAYIPRARCLESKALKLYLFSFRNVGMFHEALVGRICADVERVIHPETLLVVGKMNARGGISIDVEAYGGRRPAKAPALRNLLAREGN